MKEFNSGPVALTATYGTNLLNPPTATGGVGGGSSAQFILLTHIHVVNKGVVPATFRMFKGLTGGTAAGTELFFDQLVVVAGTFDWYPQKLRLDAADFLTGGASVVTTLVAFFMGKIGVAG
jgi:hypothetical protein